MISTAPYDLNNPFYFFIFAKQKSSCAYACYIYGHA